MKNNKQVANKGWIKKVAVATVSLSVLGATSIVMAKAYEGTEGQTTREKITQATQNQVQTQENKMITKEEAKQIAFEAAGVKEEQVKYLRVNLEFEDDQYTSNGYVYEIEFIHGGLEYEFKIDSVNQRIIDADIDAWND